MSDAISRMFVRGATHERKTKVARAPFDPWGYVERTQSEDAHQVALFMWANKAAEYGIECAEDPDSYHSMDHCLTFAATSLPQPSLHILHAIPNGGARDPVTAARLKATGVKAGVPDVMLPAAHGGYHGLYIELKRPKAVRADGTKQTKGSLQNHQKTFMNELRNNGYCVAHCVGWRNAVDAIKYYLAMRRG